MPLNKETKPNQVIKNKKQTVIYNQLENISKTFYEIRNLNIFIASELSVTYRNKLVHTSCITTFWLTDFYGMSTCLGLFYA